LQLPRHWPSASSSFCSMLLMVPREYIYSLSHSLCQRTTIFMIQNLVEALCEWNIRCCWLYAWKCYKGKRWSVVFLIFFNLFVEWLALLTVLLCSCRKLIGFTILLWCGWWERTEKLAH
jgi:hypothetical protein